jgi:hypothetical protein
VREPLDDDSRHAILEAAQATSARSTPKTVGELAKQSSPTIDRAASASSRLNRRDKSRPPSAREPSCSANPPSSQEQAIKSLVQAWPNMPTAICPPWRRWRNSIERTADRRTRVARRRLGVPKSRGRHLSQRRPLASRRCGFAVDRRRANAGRKESIVDARQQSD